MNHLAVIVEQDRGDEALAVLLSLLFDQAVEAADRVRLETGHGAAAVENEDEF